MKLKSIDINGVAGITSLNINFKDGMNIICGPNGIGKTTILECVAHCFTASQTNILKRNANSEAAFITATLDNNQSTTLTFEQFEPNDNHYIKSFYELSKYLISLKTTRTFSHQPLNEIKKDTAKNEQETRNQAIHGVELHDLKNWFVNRYLFSSIPDALDEAQLENLNLAKNCFSQLNPDFSFHQVNPSSLEISIKSPTGRIYYEYLSSGFKSTLFILFGIIKEIEFRFPKTKARDFSGIVLIDEIELHLHPEWQGRLPQILKNIFPKIQFITTTHSPHVIQSAESSEIIALEQSQGNVINRMLPNSVYGFKGWTVDEVLTDVMGMTDTRTEFFREKLAQFNLAIDTDNEEAAQKVYNELLVALHPQNSLSKLLKIQLAGIGG